MFSDVNYYGQFPNLRTRCEVKTLGEQCPNVAMFKMYWGEKSGYCCGSCLASYIYLITKSGRSITVERIKVE